jgi:vacuolar-type H+-ATPase subunit E/Vma4
MGFEELISELHKQAESEAAKAMRQAESSARKIEQEASAKADEAVRGAKSEAAQFAKQESSERLTSAKLAAKKILDEARDEAVEASLRHIWFQFKADSLHKGTYPQLLDGLVKEGLAELGTTDAVVYVRDEDRALVSGYQLSRLPPEYSGGAILESPNGRIRVNKTLEEAFSQKKGELRKMIYDKLF